MEDKIYNEAEAAWSVNDPVKLNEMWENGNLFAAQHLAHMYQFGEEQMGVFINPSVARDICEDIGEDYDDMFAEAEDEGPVEILQTEYVVHGDKSEIDAIDSLFGILAERYGWNGENEQLTLSVQIVMKALVGSGFYAGNINYAERCSPEGFVMHAGLEKPYALRYALLQCFPSVDIEMNTIS